MASGPGWHASTRRGEPTSSVSNTGEIRVPLALYQVDQHQGDVPLVLSRADAEELHAALCAHLGLADVMGDER